MARRAFAEISPAKTTGGPGELRQPEFKVGTQWKSLGFSRIFIVRPQSAAIVLLSNLDASACS